MNADIAKNSGARRFRSDRRLRHPRSARPRISGGGRRAQTASVAEEQRARSRTACHVDGRSCAGAAAARPPHRCRRQLPRRAAGRPGQRHGRRASRFRRKVVAGFPREQTDDPIGAYLDSRNDRDRPNRLQHHQARGRAADRGLRRAVRDPAAGLRGGACGLWRQRDGALARGVSARSAGRRTGRAIPAGRDGGYCRDHRLACRARSRPRRTA